MAPASPRRACSALPATICRSTCPGSNRPELLQIGWNDQYSQELRNQTRANLNYRLVEVVMMFLLPLLAVALAVPPKRSTSALGIFLSIVMVVAYHKINQYGQDVAALGRIDPVLALWGPFVGFAALIVWMYWRIAYVPGGQPIGALESMFAKAAKAVRKLFVREAGARRRQKRDTSGKDAAHAA